METEVSFARCTPRVLSISTWRARHDFHRAVRASLCQKSSVLSVSNIWFFYVRTHPVGVSTTPWVAFSPTSGPWGTSELDPGDPAEPNTEAFLWPDHQLMKFVLFQMY